MISNNLENKTAVALGKFDGLHTGHTAVIKETLSLAKEKGLRACALLFDIHPDKITRGKAPEELLTAEQREKLLKNAGVDVIYLSFEEIYKMSCEAFAEEILKKKLNASDVCCGYNYHFGFNGTGTAEDLKRICNKKGIDVSIAPQVDYEGTAVSATRIRACLKSGNVRSANEMLGREFSYDFEVVSGDRRGRLLGFPTINQCFPGSFIVPKFGVYASKTFVDNEWRSSVTNIGSRPSFDSNEVRSETYILDFSSNLYGMRIEVALLGYMREEKRFTSVESLKAQIKADAENATQHIL